MRAVRCAGREDKVIEDILHTSRCCKIYYGTSHVAPINIVDGDVVVKVYSRK